VRPLPEAISECPWGLSPAGVRRGACTRAANIFRSAPVVARITRVLVAAAKREIDSGQQSEAGPEKEAENSSAVTLVRPPALRRAGFGSSSCRRLGWIWKRSRCDACQPRPLQQASWSRATFRPFRLPSTVTAMDSVRKKSLAISCRSSAVTASIFSISSSMP
jgi:hypothetical protein